MAQQLQTPGVSIVEVDGFSSSVVEVPTAVPVFIGYTEYAKNGNQPLLNVPMPINSMVQFLKYYGNPTSALYGAPAPKFTYTSNTTTMPPCMFDPANPRFNLYYSMMLFFNNGGGNCYIVSIGSYASATANGPAAGDYGSVFTALEQYAEPTMVVMPDAMLLNAADWKSVAEQALTHCEAMQSRVAIYDVWNGYLPTDNTADDVISGSTGFYTISGLGETFNKYGIGYYPWINTNIVSSNNVDYTWLNAGSLPTLISDLTNEANNILFPAPNAKLAPYLQIVASMANPPVPTAADPTGVNTIHKTILTVSPLYQQTIQDIATSVNLLPPSGAMAGVYTRNDNTFGVYQSPANTTIISAISPAVAISDNDQAALNVPLNGCAVNAIRTFPNYGLLVWGARTMAGNSDDWRYISVRRTMIMLEQSIKAAMQAYVFQSNDNLTWVAVNSTITNFLTSQWKVGALQGAKPTDAFTVSVGLGSTMTGEDILQGLMNVSIGVAVVRPAEFIVLTFQQQMQTS